MRLRAMVITLLFALLIFGQMMLSASEVSQEPVPTVDPFPRPNVIDLIVAEQVFEGGRMFYLQPVNRIWVLIESEDDETVGEWQVFIDTWEDGEMVSDPNLDVPDGLHQPIRGFGKLWRENEDIREALGWALDPEIGHMTTYYFAPGESTVEDGEIVTEPGIHGLDSYYGRIIAFDEAEGTWYIIEDEEDAEEAEALPLEATEEPSS